MLHKLLVKFKVEQSKKGGFVIPVLILSDTSVFVTYFSHWNYEIFQNMFTQIPTPYNPLTYTDLCFCKLFIDFRNASNLVSMKVLRMEYNKLYFSEYKKLFCKLTAICFIGLT